MRTEDKSKHQIFYPDLKAFQAEHCFVLFNEYDCIHLPPFFVIVAREHPALCSQPEFEFITLLDRNVNMMNSPGRLLLTKSCTL